MRRFAALLGLAIALVAPARAATGLAELPADAISGPVTVFYPAAAPAAAVRRGPFTLDVAVYAPPASGNRRLVVISHGSPGSPWVHADLARALVESGFVVALPEHHADNYKDDSEPGPPSWRRRPAEVSRAIDRLGADPRFGPALDLDRVGMFGMSAGGHTALTLAGGRWSPSRLRSHCQQHLADDFHACAGPSLSLSGGLLDPVKLALVRTVINTKLDDGAWYTHPEPRIAAIVAGASASSHSHNVAPASNEHHAYRLTTRATPARASGSRGEARWSRARTVAAARRDGATKGD
jgi:predicted dienelactone hydrolase